MNYKKTIEFLSKSMMDNITDGEMLFSFTKKMKDCGNVEMGNFFLSRIKVRLQMANEDNQKIMDLVKKYKQENDKVDDLWDWAYDYLIKQKEELDYKVQSFKM